jgi:hypothetical protein
LCYEHAEEVRRHEEEQTYIEPAAGMWLRLLQAPQEAHHPSAAAAFSAPSQPLAHATSSSSHPQPTRNATTHQTVIFATTVFLLPEYLIKLPAAAAQTVGIRIVTHMVEPSTATCAVLH